VNVVVFGASGQLGRALSALVPSEANVTLLDRSSCDLVDTGAIARSIDAHVANVVVNAAAYTAVDRAEVERDTAYAINADAVGIMAEVCSRRGARLVHVSTDFVFDGSMGRPYLPSDEPRPLNVYGASKLAGEAHLSGRSDLSWRIIRTAWVYASSGRNFVQTMLRLFREREQVQVVADQIGTPTSASSLAECVWRAAFDDGKSAVLHFTDAGVASWYDFAVAIYEEAVSLGMIEDRVAIVPITTDQFPSAARRPLFSVLDKSHTVQRLSLIPIHWRAKLRQTLKEML
jgi:dTDP-4-dehydrorhamnose reductase